MEYAKIPYINQNETKEPLELWTSQSRKIRPRNEVLAGQKPAQTGQNHINGC
jgi:hypothetical protein